MENNKVNRLFYYGFDWDDNILHMPTIIYMDKLVNGTWEQVSISPSEFALIRDDSNYRIRDNDAAKAYEEFRDFGPRGNKSFVNDVRLAIEEGAFGPSWNKFIKCLTEGALFAIITARGHEYNTIKEGAKYVIDNCLTVEQQDLMYENCLKFAKVFEKRSYTRKYNCKFTENDLIKTYLECCKYYGVGVPLSESFKKDFKISGSIRIEEAKKMVLGKFIEICNEYGSKINAKVSIGFSDDDKKNVEHVKKFFEFKSAIYDKMKFNVYDTSNKGNIKTEINIAEAIDMGPSISNKDSSILKFMGPNSMANTLQFSTNDFSQPNYTALQKVKVANLLTKPVKKKFTKKLKKDAKSKNNDNPA